MTETNRQPTPAREPGPRSIREALRQARPRYVRPTACLTCGGELPPDRPAYCSMDCAKEARR